MFNEEHQIFRESVRQFVEKEIMPLADQWEEKGEIPKNIWQKMGALGFLGINLPENFGGAEADFFYSVVFLEEIGRAGYGGLAASVAVQEYMAIAHLAKAGSHELKQKYLAPAIAGQMIGAIAISEPNIGSDVANLETTAKLEGDEYVITGSKMFITNGTFADFVTVAARTGGPGPDGISLIIVDCQADGFQAMPLKKMGWHCSGTAELNFDQVRVPKSNLIGKENRGFYYIMESFQLERLTGAILSIGGMDRALQETLKYIQSRKAFKRPVASFQAVRHRLVDLMTEVEAARHLTYHACSLYEKGEMAVEACSMAKLMTSELSCKLADACVQFHGGYGYMEEYPVARFYRDAKVGTIAGGTSEIMREILAKTCVDGVRYQSHYTPQVDPKEVIQSLNKLITLFNPQKANALNASMLIDIQGVDPHTIKINDGKAQLIQGSIDPRASLSTDSRTWLQLQSGQLAPEAAFMNGALKVENPALVMQVIAAFDRPL